jgi:hypothetical protein
VMRDVRQLPAPPLSSSQKNAYRSLPGRGPACAEVIQLVRLDFSIFRSARAFASTVSLSARKVRLAYRRSSCGRNWLQRDSCPTSSINQSERKGALFTSSLLTGGTR